MNISLSKLIYDENKTEITLHEDTPNLVLKISDCSLEVVFRYHVKTTPELVEETGTGLVWLNNFMLAIKANPYVSESML